MKTGLRIPTETGRCYPHCRNNRLCRSNPTRDANRPSGAAGARHATTGSKPHAIATHRYRPGGPTADSSGSGWKRRRTCGWPGAAIAFGLDLADQRRRLVGELDANLVVTGDLQTTGSLRIEGRLEGSVLKADSVVIGVGATM